MNIKLGSVLFVIASTACSANVDTGRSAESQLDSNNSNSNSNCFWDVVTSRSTGCESDGDLQNDAQLACGAKGGAIDAFEGDEACGKGLSQQAKYECCLVSPPPPCFTQTVGDAKQCQSDAALDKAAVSACAAQSAKLVKFAPDEACPTVPPEGASYFATIECCY